MIISAICYTSNSIAADELNTKVSVPFTKECEQEIRSFISAGKMGRSVSLELETFTRPLDIQPNIVGYVVGKSQWISEEGVLGVINASMKNCLPWDSTIYQLDQKHINSLLNRLKFSLSRGKTENYIRFDGTRLFYFEQK